MVSTLIFFKKNILNSVYLFLTIPAHVGFWSPDQRKIKSAIYRYLKRMKNRPLTLEAQSLNYWTTRDVTLL